MAAPEARIGDSTERPLRRVGRLDFAGLAGIRDAVGSGRDARLRLNLFRGVEFEAAVERSAPTASGYTLSGPLRGVPFGRMVLAVNGGHALGRVYTPGGLYVIRTAGAVQSVERREPKPLRCGVGAQREASPERRDGSLEPDALQPEPGTAQWAPRDLGAARAKRAGAAGGPPRRAAAASRGDSADGEVVDVLVVYPSFAREIEGGYGPMLALIDLDIATANEAYAASGLGLRVNLAAAVEVEYDRFLHRWLTGAGTPGIWIDAVEHLAGRDDGHLDGVHGLRDRHAADLVLMHFGGELFGDFLGPGIGGIAHGVFDVSAEVLEELGFSVALSGDGTTVAHELGHSMGLHHDRRDDVGNRPFPYSHGFAYEHAAPRGPGGYYARASYGTIMATVSNRGAGYVLGFSDPDRSHPEDPDLKLGVAGDEPSDSRDGPADAARHLAEVGGTVAGVRARADADACRYEISGSADTLPPSGGTYRLDIETGPDCPWTASPGEWVSSVSESSGTGSGGFEVSVGANDGWERPVEVLVSGRLHARRQAGSRPITPVCERSSAVRGRLQRNHPDYDEYANQLCRDFDFSADILAGVRHLYPSTSDGLDGAKLRPGDLDGLTGLARLEIYGMEAVPPDLFNGLNGLRLLEFFTRYQRPTTLRRIEPGAFRGLPGLWRLTIRGHRVRRFGAGAFEGMPRLLYLDVAGGRFDYPERRAPATAIDPGAMAGLRDLRRLRFYWHELEGLQAGVFDGLGELTELVLANNAIQALPAGVFRNLSKLDTLNLYRNGLTALPHGLFEGLSNLVRLYIGRNRVSALDAGVFDGLESLWSLSLHDNRLRRLPRGVFEGLPNLEWLILPENRLSELEPGFLGNLPSLLTLDLNENGIEALKPGLFEGVSNLELLLLGGNGLRTVPPGAFEGLDRLRTLVFWGNDLGRIRAGAFDGLDRLRELNLRQGGVTSIEPGAFDGRRLLRRMTLQGNRLHGLDRGALRGLRLYDLDLRDNPGTPFTFAPRPVALSASDPAAGRPLEVAVEIPSAAPFEVTASLSASGGTLSRREVRVAPGEARSETAAAVVPDGKGPVTVRVDGRPSVVSNRSWCNAGRLMGPTREFCYRGVRVAAGPPLAVYGIEDRELTPGRGPEAIGLADVFAHLLGPGAEYVASTSDAAVAAVEVEGETLTVTPGAVGTARVTVTATGADGETRTRGFTVAVRAPSVPLLLSASRRDGEGFVRLVNRSGTAGDVRITAFDDAGTPHGPVALRLRPHGAVHFNSGDLEDGNPAKGLAEGVGFGKDDWRLEFDSALDVEALAYVRRRADGFLTGMHDVAPAGPDGRLVATFNPASNTQQASRLRVVNPGPAPAEVAVRGVDDAGASPGGPVRFTVAAGAARTLTAADLESGAAGLDGALGDGEGKWRLEVASAAPIQVMSLLESAATGHLTNLSAGPVAPDAETGAHHVPLFPAASAERQGFARVVNRSARGGTVRIDAFGDAGELHGPLELALDAGATAHFNSDDLELGNAAKGLSGSTGPGGGGDWRLELTSGLDIAVLAYVRTEDGFLTTMHDVVEPAAGRRRVATFNPGSNTRQASRLRLVNPARDPVVVAVHGTDDRGWSADVSARVEVPPMGSLTLSSAELEAGLPHAIFEGHWERLPLGDGRGKWRLAVYAEGPVRVMGLLESPTGHLTNLSSAPNGGN